jgi:hypothetical protein
MAEARTKAKLVGAAPFETARAVSATVPRSEIEQAAKAKKPAPLVLDITRSGDGGGADVSAHTLEIKWDKRDLEKLLSTTSGDEVTLTFDRGELEHAIEADVEAHGLRETAVVLTVAATTAVMAGAASARPGDTGGVVGLGPQTEMISDSASSVAAPTQPTQLASDVATGQGYGQPADSAQLASDASTGQGYGPSESGQLASDVATGRGYGQPAETAQLASDASTGQGYGQPGETAQLASDASTGQGYGQPGETAQLASDAATGQGYGPAETAQLASDVATGQGYGHAPGPGPSTAASGGGIDISAPSPSETGALAGGLALLITGAGFAVRGRRRAARPT